MAFDFIMPFFISDGVHLKSLRWPGFEFWMNGTSFSNLYFGFGLPEANLGESLAPILPHAERTAYLAPAHPAK
jgi:hypothetical protein